MAENPSELCYLGYFEFSPKSPTFEFFEDLNSYPGKFRARAMDGPAWENVIVTDADKDGERSYRALYYEICEEIWAFHQSHTMDDTGRLQPLASLPKVPYFMEMGDIAETERRPFTLLRRRLASEGTQHCRLVIVERNGRRFRGLLLLGDEIPREEHAQNDCISALLSPDGLHLDER